LILYYLISAYDSNVLVSKSDDLEPYFNANKTALSGLNSKAVEDVEELIDDADLYTSKINAFNYSLNTY